MIPFEKYPGLDWTTLELVAWWFCAALCACVSMLGGLCIFVRKRSSVALAVAVFFFFWLMTWAGIGIH